MISSTLYKLHVKALLGVLKRIKYGQLTLTLPDGCTHNFKSGGEGPSADVHIHTGSALGRIMSDGKMGFCESFIMGEVSSSNLASLVEFVVRQNTYVEENLKFSKLKTMLRRAGHWVNRNTKEGSRRNISAHYDLGNGFYDKWLDPSMTYSSAFFEKDDDDLKSAQIAKYRKLAELAGLQSGDRVLEIGCGWGGFAEFAASHYDVDITAITISQQQFDFANKRMADAGLSHKVDVALTDYRDVDRSFDKIISIEMFEAVGEAYWPTYFECLSRCLQKGGKAALQIITIDDSIFEDYKREPDFIQKYVFPGGMLPSLRRLEKPIMSAGLRLFQENGFGLHYAKTLKLWRDRFLAAWPEIANQHFDERFKRIWELYLAYCEGGFKAGQIDVNHMLIERQ
ncbi:MAG: cyclopropane-fatty-acyl-phospholipid synthase family protein [Parvularculales bacterium]